MANKSIHQLEYMSVSENENILIGVSNLINSSNWTGQLWYFSNENDLTSGKIDENDKGVEYPLSLGTASGIFLDNDKFLVGNDMGMIAIYELDRTEDENSGDSLTIFNKMSRTEHDRSVLSLAVSKTSNKFLSGSMDRSVKLWDTETLMPSVSYDQVHTNYVTFVGFVNSDTNDDKLFISASFDGSLLAWDCRNPNPARVLMEEKDYRPTHVAWFNDEENLIFIGCDYGTIRLIDVRNPKEPVLVHEFSRSRSVNTLRPYVRDSKKYLSVCGNTRNMKVYEYDQQLLEIYSNESHGDHIQDTAWLSKTETLLSCSWDSQIIKHQPFKVTNSSGDE